MKLIDEKAFHKLRENKLHQVYSTSVFNQPGTQLKT